MTAELVPSLIAGAVSLLILVTAYGLMWWRSRQPSMALWGAGWAVYTVHFVTIGWGQISARLLLWRFTNLATLGLSAFLLCAGTYSFIGTPFQRRTYAWGLFPLFWATVAFLHLPFDYRIAAAPIFAFAAVIDVFTALALFRYGRRIRGRPTNLILALSYGTWAGLKIAQPALLPGGYTMLALSLVTNELALVLALTFVAISLIEAEREARRRAERLEMLSTIATAAANQLLSLDELLEETLDGLARLLKVESGLGIYLYRRGKENGRLRLAAGRGLPTACLDSPSDENCACHLAARTGQLVSPAGPITPPSPRPPGCPALLAVPLTSRGRTLGAFCAALSPDYPLTSGERRALETIGQQLATAIENAHLYAEEQRRAEEASLLLEIANAIGSTLELDDILKEVTLRAARACEANRCSIVLLDKRGETLLPIMSQFASGRTDPELWRLFKETSYPQRVENMPDALQVIRTRRPLFIPDATASSLPRSLVEPFGAKSILIVPLVGREQVIGLMGLDRPEIGHAFTAEQVDLAVAIASQAAVAIENARLYKEITRRLTQAQVLREVMLAAASTLDFDQVLERTCETLEARMGVEFLCFAMPDEEEKGLRLHPSQIGFSPATEEFRLPLDGSICGLVFRTGEPVLVEDVRENPHYFEGAPEARSELTVPVRVGGRVIGVLNVESRRSNAFDEEDLAFYTTIAGQLGIALENARLYQETARRLAQTQVLREVMLAAASTLDFDRVLEQAMQVLDRTLGVEYLNFMLPDEDGKYMVTHPSMLGFTPPPERVFRFPTSSCITGRVYRTGQPALVPDVRQDPDYSAAADDVRSELAVPVRVGGEVVAVLNLESRRLNAFDEEDLAFYTAIAGQLGVALENARLYQEEQRRRREAETLYRAAQALTTTLDLRKVLDTILTELQQVVPYDSASVQLLEGGGFKIIGGRGFPNLDELLGITFRPDRDNNPSGQIVKTRAPLILDDAPTVYPEFRREPHAAAGIRSWMGVPLLFADRLIGMLTLDKREPGFYNAEHARVAMAFAGQAAIAIENARLYQRLEEQSARLSHTLRELQELSRLRDQVVQNVSHELRTPLTLIQGYADLLIKGDLGPIAPQQRDALEMILDRTVILARLIYNLTTLRTLSQRVLAVSPLSLAEIVRKVLSNYHDLAARAGVRFEDSLPADLPPVMGDKERLGLVFMHLIDNAIKFSPDGGTVRVSAWAEDGQVHVSVRDEGIGIAPEHIGRIFERFYQVNGSTTRQFGGMGVGLALVWEIVEAHGGTVDVESEPGKGSTFTVSLPQAEE